MTNQQFLEAQQTQGPSEELAEQIYQKHGVTISRCPSTGPWYVVLAVRTGQHKNYNPHYWYIYNTTTRQFKRIGLVSEGRGTNYFDQAQGIVAGLNAQIEREQNSEY